LVPHAYLLVLDYVKSSDKATNDKDKVIY